MTSTSPGGSKSFGKRLSALPPRLWVALALLVLGAIFIAQNRSAVRVRWLTLDLTSPLWSALLVMMLIGLLIGLLLRRRSSRRR
ncbi:DUF1049 domain-containing protein [Streptosporangium sp. NPDC051022]|uniref:DUF1049 domain-containing protein n=1 Tax=Streptosporangium sp. NPDC051022 TaxID=3155752 RepID=UPI0034187306